MSKNKAIRRKNREKDEEESGSGFFDHVHPDLKKSIWAIALTGFAVILVLAGIGKSGPAGEWIFLGLQSLVGIGYYALPLALVLTAGIFVFRDEQRVVGVTLLGVGFMLMSVLGLIDIVSPQNGGWLGFVLGFLRIPLGNAAAIVINLAILASAGLLVLNVPLKFRRATKTEFILEPEEEKKIEPAAAEAEAAPKDKDSESTEAKKKEDELVFKPVFRKKNIVKGDYVPPPLSLLASNSEKPTTGDLRANANIIKRTLESFGIQVEMGEISIGPKVTRYTLKPAEGVKLTRITALGQDLALALAAHPIRIEAPIPGKSLVGIEVPNKAAALVRLGNLMAYEEPSPGPLTVALGRDVTGEPIFVNIEKMPHLLVAGSTGSGKSVCIHSLIISMLYKNSPQNLKMVLVDPKRVELSAYEGLPHLVSPVVIENKKAVGVFRWAINEMERRYDMLLKAGSRDIKSYNTKNSADPMPYLIIIVDELADLMTSYGREVEGSIIRLAQMARATGLHLILSTQRPSVEIITGLIKANITSRVAFQVASQIDSRTILDTAGAEKLLGGGDMLFISSELSKPKRIQGAYLTEDEINKVADFVRKNNVREDVGDSEINFSVNGAGESGQNGHGGISFGEYFGDSEDDLYEEAVKTVVQAGKASASLLQRRLKVGYARAARLLDIMEERGVVGPGEGAKPREVFVSAQENGGVETDEEVV